MRFYETSLHNAVLIELDRLEDERGYFARSFCEDEFARQGLETRFVQANLSFNRLAGTLRGMHYQKVPHAEVKLVRAVSGAIYDVIVDLRPDSPSYLRWEGFELTAESGRMLYVPQGFAHGFQALADETHVTYQVSHAYTPGAEGGLRWNDPAFRFTWPLPLTCISAKDAGWPDANLEQGIPI